MEYLAFHTLCIVMIWIRGFSVINIILFEDWTFATRMFLIDSS